MAAYKRSNPTQLRKEREAILKDVEKREEKPLLERAVGEVKKRIHERRQRRAGQGPLPRVRGALQYGFKPEDKTT